MKKLWIIIKHGEIPWKFFMTLIPPKYLVVYSLCHFFHFYCVIFPHLSLFFGAGNSPLLRHPSHTNVEYGADRGEEKLGGRRDHVSWLIHSIFVLFLLDVWCCVCWTIQWALLCSIVIIYHSDIVIYMCVPNTQIVHIFSTTFTIIIVIIISDQ